MRLSPNELKRFADRYLLALETALKELPEQGNAGLELEWNLLDSDFQPLQTVGAGPDERSFVDVLRQDFLPAWLQDRHQLEVFHWMIEWATRPYYAAVGAVYEGRLLEACLLNAMSHAGRSYGKRLFTYHGNLLAQVEVGPASIPHGWSLAKKRYLARCVDLYGAAMATCGVHSNVSLPAPLLSWDFMHLSPSERADQHLDQYKNQVYIDGTRLMRAYTALFTATGANTPMQVVAENGNAQVLLSESDSVRNLTFPNPESLDVPGLYRSHEDYIRLSRDLVRRGVRFGNNNWTPVRARSFVEPVERLIGITSDQLHNLYRSGLYAHGEQPGLEELAHQIEVQNLLARIDIPMERVEIRSDEGGHDLHTEIANLALKEILLIAFYADPTYGRAFRYDAEDLARARRNETLAAANGLRAEIEHPHTAKTIPMRDFLRQTLDDLQPLAQALGRWELLAPLHEMAQGAPNSAEKLRARIREELGDDVRLPAELLRRLAQEHEDQVVADVEAIAGRLSELGPEAVKLERLFWRARDEARRDSEAPVRFRPPIGATLEVGYRDKTDEILDLAQALVRIPSVSNAPPDRQRLDEIDRAATFIHDYLSQAGLELRIYEGDRYPAILAAFPNSLQVPVMLSGHFDVVEPDPDDSQFEPYLEGDYLWGRGAADMKTVVATYMVWMKDALRRGAPYPLINMMLIGNEEVAEGEPYGTPHVLQALIQSDRYQPSLMIAGERTGERGVELMGEICLENRGLVRFELSARGIKGHTGIAGARADLNALLHQTQNDLLALFREYLTLEAADGWRSQARFPFVRVGEPGIYNVSAEYGLLGVEIRPIPQDDVAGLVQRVQQYSEQHGLSIQILAAQNGIVCARDNPYLGCLIEAVHHIGGGEPHLGRKLPGTSARFAPDGQGVVWGQSGFGPHAADERHFVPSIEPYYQALDRMTERLHAIR